MEGQNKSSGFIVLGFSGNLEVQSLFFVLLLAMYTMSLVGNTSISVIVRLEPALHTPMCYFIASLSVVDICYTSVTAPKMLANLLSKDKAISFIGCAAQLYFLLFLGTTECFLLAAMAYDRFLAICNPLRYTSIMTKHLCAYLVVGSWVSGMVLSLGQTSLIFVLPFCEDNQIDYFFCDIPPLLKLACGDISVNEITVFLAGLLITLIPSLLILGSYIHIIISILKIASAKGRQKAFSTCSSHLIVITLFYGSASAMYLRPSSSYVLENDKFLALLYSIITPTLNPIIYSLRSKEINEALKRRLTSTWIFSAPNSRK
ncbi:olfactory receptor 10A7-like [Tiliqua scincoides]|uniref:olfactory receptor 10A7-like n=1 Tax=Tiliqua scincoides TaxID=71010 RepID=UPI0034624143